MENDTIIAVVVSGIYLVFCIGLWIYELKHAEFVDSDDKKYDKR